MRLSTQLRALVGDVRPGEMRLALALHVQFAAIVFALLVARTARDALYVSRAGIDRLPWMYVGIGVVTMLATGVYARFVSADRLWRRAWMVQAVFALSFWALAVALAAGAPAFAALYLWVEVLTAITVLQFWTLTNQRFHPRQAKRLYGLIAAGQAVGNLACGVVASLVGSWLDTVDLLWVVAAASAAMAMVYARQAHRPAPSNVVQPVRRRLSPRRSSYVATILALVACTFLATSWVDFQFKVIAKRSFTEAELTRFFGQFYAAVGCASFVVQFFLLQRLLRWFGVFRSLALMPAAFAGLGLGLVMAPGLWLATALKFSENGLRYGVFEPVLQFLYLPLGAEDRLRAQALAGGVVKPLAMGAAGLALVVWRPDQVNGVAASWLGLPVAAAAMLVLLLLSVARRGYLQTLATDVQNAFPERRRPRWRIGSPAALARIEAVARAGPAGAVEWIVDRIALNDAAMQRRVWALVAARPDLDPALRVHAWRALDAADRPVPTANDPLLTALAHPQPDRGWAELLGHVDASRADLAQTAIAELAASGSAEASAAARDALVLWSLSPDPQERVLAIRLASWLPSEERRERVGQALADVDAAVRRAALLEVARAPAPEWLAAVKAALDERPTRAAAVVALAAYGQSGLAALGPITEAVLRLGRAWPAYVRQATAVDWAGVLTALCGCGSDPLFWPAPALALRRLPQNAEVLVRTAVQAAQRWAAWLPALDRPEAVLRLLQRAAIDRVEASVTCALALLFIQTPPPLEHWQRLLLSGFWRDPRRRANLAEILDQTVVSGFKAPLLTLFDAGARAAATDPHVWTQLSSIDRHLAKRGGIIAAAEPKEFAMEEIIERVLFLSSVPLFADLAGADLEQIAAAMTAQEVAAGGPLMRQGDPGDSLYLIAEGRVRVHIGAQELATLGPGAVVGEMALLDDQPRSANVTALERVRVFKLDRLDFEMLLDTYPTMARAIMRVLSARLRDASAKLRG